MFHGQVDGMYCTPEQSIIKDLSALSYLLLVRVMMIMIMTVSGTGGEEEHCKGRGALDAGNFVL